jgi:hypothetical protein
MADTPTTGDDAESEVEGTTKAYGFGPFVLSASSTGVDGVLMFNYQRRDVLALRRTIIDLPQTLSDYGVVVVGEGNMSFSFALAAYFQSWNGIISTVPSAVEDSSALLDSGYALCKSTCLSNQRLLLLDEQKAASVFTTMLQQLNLPLLSAPVRAPYQHMKRTIQDLVMEECIQTATSRIESVYDMADSTCICDSVDPFNLETSKVAGDIVGRNLWFQCPWKGPGDHRSTASQLLQFLNQAAACQQGGGFVLIGFINLYPYCTQYGLMDLLTHPDYEFVGYDDNLIRELLLMGYSFESRYVIDGAENSHVTMVFRKRE